MRVLAVGAHPDDLGLLVPEPLRSMQHPVDDFGGHRHFPQRYSWADPDYAVVHASILSCNAHL